MTNLGIDKLYELYRRDADLKYAGDVTEPANMLYCWAALRDKFPERKITLAQTKSYIANGLREGYLK